MWKMDTNCDLIKTIEDDQEVPNFSEDSDVEDDVRHNLTNYIRLNSTTLLIVRKMIVYCMILILEK